MSHGLLIIPVPVWEELDYQAASPCLEDFSFADGTILYQLYQGSHFAAPQVNGSTHSVPPSSLQGNFLPFPVIVPPPDAPDACVVVYSA